MQAFSIHLNFGLEFATAALASEGQLAVSADRRTITFDMSETIDAVILR